MRPNADMPGHSGRIPQRSSPVRSTPLRLPLHIPVAVLFSLLILGVGATISLHPKNLSCCRAACSNRWQAMGLLLIEGVTRWVSRN